MSACLNCAEPFAEPRPRFCPACGQESNVRPPRIGEFVQQFGGAYFATEGALWRTLKLLLFKPGELTRQYLAGRRKHYVLPLRLYLTISVIVLLLMRLLAGDGDDSAIKFDIDRNRSHVIAFSLGDTGAGLRDGKFFCDGLPAWVCKRMQRRFAQTDEAGLRRQATELSQRFMSNLGAAVFVMLPIFALWLKLAWFNRGMRYTEHLVFALHLHAFWFVALAFALPDRAWLSALAFTAVPLYAMLALRRVYAGRWWPRHLRALLVSVLYLLTLAFVMAGMVLITLLY